MKRVVPAHSAAVPPRPDSRGAGTRCAIALGMLLAALTCGPAMATEGKVAWSDPSCNYFIAKVGDEYGMYEWRSPNGMTDGDDLSGDMLVEGIQPVDNKTSGKKSDIILVAMHGRLNVLIGASPAQCKRRFTNK
jgi:hypothetical protein